MNEFLVVSQIALALSIGYIFFIMHLLSHKSPKKYPLNTFPKVSVLVAFRNEEKNILACCDALSKLDYPADKLEILMLNDQSTDQSTHMVRDFITGKPQFKLIDIDGAKKNLQAKMNVLAQGIPKSNGEFIFITDADCRPLPGWIKTMLQYFDPSIGLISGFTILEEKAPKPFSKLQTVDWIFLQGLAFTASNSGKPITVMGNNLAFRRNVYEQVGGFETIGFSITEDHALMKAILDKTNKEVKYVRDKEGLVLSAPVKDFTEFINQRMRWVKGGMGARPFAYFLVGFSFLTHLSIIAIFIMQQWNMISATAIGLILGIDHFMLKMHLKDLEKENLKKHFLRFELFYIFYPLVLFILVPFTKRIKWKGRKL
jgi:cellulose synthase/poly-beta-1,6-N-acetylglucosamine synthase-like glycosyltransferase